jgi:hypothetical protein
LAACGSNNVDYQTTTLQSGKHILALDVGKPGGAQILSLPSGKKIKVLTIYELTFTKGPPALIFSYQTDLSLDDMPALQREVNEIWPIFRLNVEHAGLTGAVISANEKPAGGLTKENRGYNFVFHKASDGSWAQANN